MEKDLLQDQARTMDGLCFKKLELVFASSHVLLAFYISCWEKYLLNTFAHFLNWFPFVLLSYLHFCIVWTLDLYQIRDLQVFFPVQLIVLSLSRLCPWMHRDFKFQ